MFVYDGISAHDSVRRRESDSVSDCVCDIVEDDETVFERKSETVFVREGCFHVNEVDREVTTDREGVVVTDIVTVDLEYRTERFFLQIVPDMVSDEACFDMRVLIDNVIERLEVLANETGKAVVEDRSCDAVSVRFNATNANFPRPPRKDGAHVYLHGVV